ncbi:nucleotidyltransferase family protein [Sphingomonas sp.]|jgi:hypothetical protein|uniref:nucleotidyltransferase family protein n=1 Tax=Sphingomonas sp. TaxID=28214 RepID=UPI002D7F5ACA|nr:nucleotidyltransferase family protein [Sphingomonas sp.]HEU0044531.1 nucleotidyltransferase family protein [Sphingomonas sp.]
MPRPRSAEFALLLACCRWPLSAAACGDIKARSAEIDWPRLSRLAARHRVEGMVWKALTAASVEVPAPARAELSAAAARIAHQNLALAAESIQLLRRLEQVGLSPLFVKGISLGKLVYGDIGRKAGWDIDLLVAPSDLHQAAAVLGTRGYTLTIPSNANPEDLTRWHQREKESVWRSADGGTWVELHTALTNNALLLPSVGTTSPRRSVEVSPGMFLPTLGRDELFAYLCVHGASSAWFRLKWIADLAGLIGDQPVEEIDRLYQRAGELGAGRAAAQALLLAAALFDLEISAELGRELRSDPMNRLLVAIALRKLAGRTGERELDRVILGTALIHVAQLGLLPGWRYKQSELRRLLVSPLSRAAAKVSATIARQRSGRPQA